MTNKSREAIVAEAQEILGATREKLQREHPQLFRRMQILAEIAHTKQVQEQDARILLQEQIRLRNKEFDLTEDIQDITDIKSHNRLTVMKYLKAREFKEQNS